MMSVVLKNELIKMSKQAKHIVFIVLTLLFQAAFAYIVISNHLPVNGESYYHYALIGNSQLILILGILYVSQVFTEDLKQGTIKMSVVQPTQRYGVHLGKIAYVFVVLLAMQMFTFLFATFFANVFFGGIAMKLIFDSLVASLLTVVVNFSYLSLVLILAMVVDIPAIVVTVGILGTILVKPVLVILTALDVINETVSYFFVTEYFTLFFNPLPQINHFPLVAFVALVLPILIGITSSLYLFKHKDIHF